MNRIASVINTFFGSLLSFGSFVGNEGAKKAGINGLFGLGGNGQPKKKDSRGIFDNPYVKGKQSDDFLTGPPGESRIAGHSIAKSGLGGASEEETIYDYSKLNAKDDYLKGLTSDYSKACISGMDLPKHYRQQHSIKRETTLNRGPALPGMGTNWQRHDHQTNADRLKNMSLRGTSPKRYDDGFKGSTNSGSGAGKRSGAGPGGINHKSVRNFIKF